MQLTKQKIDDYRKIQRELDGIKKQVSDSLNFVKDKKFLNRDIEITRDGKKIKVKEKQLWTEVEYMGIGCDAYKILKEKYPKTFELAEEQNKKVDEVKSMEKLVFGFDSGAVTLLDYMDLTEGFLHYLLTEKYGLKAQGEAEFVEDDEPSV